MALLDRYQAAKSTIKRLTTEKEAAEEKAAAILTVKEENTRLRQQRGQDVDKISRITAETVNLNSRLDFTTKVNRELEDKLRALKAENESLRKVTAQQGSERQTLHIPCVNGFVVMRPEVYEDGAPTAFCYENEPAGVICHHITLNRVEGRLTATPLTIKKRTVPDELLQSAKRMSR